MKTPCVDCGSIPNAHSIVASKFKILCPKCMDQNSVIGDTCDHAQMAWGIQQDARRILKDSFSPKEPSTSTFPVPPKESICQEADRIVSGERREQYGPPSLSLNRLAALWSATLEVEVTPQQVCLCLIQLKISREMNGHKRDSLVDICGYSKLLDMYEEETKSPSL